VKSTCRIAWHSLYPDRQDPVFERSSDTWSELTPQFFKLVCSILVSLA
jgi:hypothetical protein